MQPRSCPLYSVEEINAFERTFLTLLDYKVLVTGRQSFAAKNDTTFSALLCRK